MSKKQDRSSQKADLPDWADEVTPADEVMEKFYAPTGVFKSGPISIPKDPDESSPALQVESREDKADQRPPAEVVKAPIITPHISAEDTFPREASLPPIPNFGSFTPPSPTGPEEFSERSAARVSTNSEITLNRDAGVSAAATLSDSQNYLFSEFASRWKRYLYPGQLAVMRALYELTFPHGTSECFTRYSELAASTKMSRRNCINVVNSLVERGFVERMEIRNNATGKGIRLRVHLNPLR